MYFYFPFFDCPTPSIINAEPLFISYELVCLEVGEFSIVGMMHWRNDKEVKSMDASNSVKGMIKFLLQKEKHSFGIILNIF